MVSYSPRAAKALSFLKKAYNDVEIFVEDTGNHSMWLFMIRNVLPESLRISSVNLLGGRARLLEACRLDQSEDGRRKLYLIDGDFDHMIGLAKPRLKFLYRLKAYCVENLLIDKNNCIQVGLIKNFRSTEAQIENRIQYDAWMADTLRILEIVFRNYAVARLLDKSVQTIGYDVKKLYENTSAGPIISREKGCRRARELAAMLSSSHGAREVFEARLKVSKNMRNLNVLYHISGKDYLFPLLYLRLTSQGIFSGSVENLKVSLARSWKGENEVGLRRRIEALAR